MTDTNQFLSDQDQSEEPAALGNGEEEIEEPWDDCNLLTFDGGGIRGYWSLLAMKKLIECICLVEMELNITHSFHPLEYQREASQIKQSQQVADSDILALEPSQRYLLCHYFDYIGGTSTGALIAIMLGRLRMTVLDGLFEYAQLAGTVFGHSGILRKLLAWVTLGTKHQTKHAENAFEDVINRRGEDLVTDQSMAGALKFPSPRYMCQTFVTTIWTRHKGLQGTPYVLKSYESPTSCGKDHQTPLGRVYPKKRTRYGTEKSPSFDAASVYSGERREYEQAHDLEICRVARAATAATTFWKPERVKNARGEWMTFEDGGISWNNPTDVGVRQIRQKHGPNRLGAVVSVGTAKADFVQEKEVGKEFKITTLKRVGAIITHTEQVHHNVRDDCKAQDVPYYRFNPDSQRHRLETFMDEWKPRTEMFGHTPGKTTLDHIKNRFEAWYECDQDIRDNFMKCARELVVRRQLRSQDRPKWERYITGSFFKCPFHACKEKRQFTFQDKFLNHCKEQPRIHYAGRPSSAQDDRLVKDSRYEGWRYQKRTEHKTWMP